MPRPPRPVRPVKLHISIPEDHWAELQLELFSTLEGRVPHGKISEWFETVSRDALERVRLARAEASACTCSLSKEHCPLHAEENADGLHP